MKDIITPKKYEEIDWSFHIPSFKHLMMENPFYF